MRPNYNARPFCLADENPRHERSAQEVTELPAEPRDMTVEPAELEGGSMRMYVRCPRRCHTLANAHQRDQLI